MAANTRVERNYFRAGEKVVLAGVMRDYVRYHSAIKQLADTEKDYKKQGYLPLPLNTISRLVGEGVTSESFQGEKIGLWQDTPMYAQQGLEKSVEKIRQNDGLDTSWASPWKAFVETAKKSLTE